MPVMDVRKLCLLSLCAALALPVAASAAPARSQIIAILIGITCKPAKPAARSSTCTGSGNTALGPTSVIHWTLEVRIAQTGVRGTLRLGGGKNSVVLGIMTNVAAGDVNGDGFSGEGSYTVRGGSGALKQRFAAATPKQLLLSATRTSPTTLSFSLNFTKVE